MITIKIERVEKVVQKCREWKQIWEEETDTRSKFGYVDTERTVDETTHLLSQTVDEENFDLNAVIRAANGL